MEIEAVDVPDLWFELPPGFVEFNLHDDPESRILRMVDTADALFTSATQEQKLRFVAAGEYILQTMISAGAQHVSGCLLRMPGDKLSQGTLCVMIESPESGALRQDRHGTAKATAAQWRSVFPDAEVGLVMLPYGISALCIRELDLLIPGVLFGLDSPVPTTVRQAQFCVPLKTGPGAALFVFTTEDIKHWAEYLEVLGGVMKSIAAEEPSWPDGSAPEGPLACVEGASS
ncbi:hypothetical protein [Streptomyces poriticola]|uniref:hypothetical protein n=1 Tax=Streptomyces poriticola TaxID=3120506 RepID=UPI002FCE43C7